MIISVRHLIELGFLIEHFFFFLFGRLIVFYRLKFELN